MIQQAKQHSDQSAESPKGQAKLEPLLVRVEEAAELLSLGRSTIYEMMDSRELPSVRWGAARRIPVAALRKWVEDHTE